MTVSWEESALTIHFYSNSSLWTVMPVAAVFASQVLNCGCDNVDLLEKQQNVEASCRCHSNSHAVSLDVVLGGEELSCGWKLLSNGHLLASGGLHVTLLPPRLRVIYHNLAAAAFWSLVYDNHLLISALHVRGKLLQPHSNFQVRPMVTVNLIWASCTRPAVNIHENALHTQHSL
jgi:hypothetical protein